jgi:hypothetical protein
VSMLWCHQRMIADVSCAANSCLKSFTWYRTFSNDDNLTMSHVWWHRHIDCGGRSSQQNAVP